jgi:hypothetical protein
MAAIPKTIVLGFARAAGVVVIHSILDTGLLVCKDGTS